MSSGDVEAEGRDENLVVPASSPTATISSASGVMTPPIDRQSPFLCRACSRSSLALSGIALRIDHDQARIRDRENLPRALELLESQLDTPLLTGWP